ncbi:MAG: hypothetical protein LM574_01245 [Archaeoglobus sp.]|jgi:hypothetical protein|nr:hypothetical protein [Archaeoglobus sp.]
MKVEVPKEQLVYAGILWYGSIISIVAITAAYIVYITGILPHYIEFDKIVELWGKKSHKFVEETNTPIGWEWLRLVMYGDFLNLLLLTFLSFLTIVCYLAIIPLLVAKKDFIYFVIALVEVLVLLLAASGLIVAGH